ncbi:MAG TPA: rod shape-determining protein, partial [Alphaproteobacteria bacterium]|nr:rod shape-determining protein [Alphaproteobacteria bacterium]
AWEIGDCLAEPVERLVSAVKQVIRRSSGAQRDALLERGLILTGGPARLKGLDRVLGRATGLRVTVPAAPELATLDGLGALFALTRQAGFGQVAGRRSRR